MQKKQTYRILHFFFFLLARSFPRPLLADLSSILRDLISRIKSKNTCKCAIDAISKLQGLRKCFINLKRKMQYTFIYCIIFISVCFYCRIMCAKAIRCMCSIGNKTYSKLYVKLIKYISCNFCVLKTLINLRQ